MIAFQVIKKNAMMKLPHQLMSIRRSLDTWLDANQANFFDIFDISTAGKLARLYQEYPFAFPKAGKLLPFLVNWASVVHCPSASTHPPRLDTFTRHMCAIAGLFKSLWPSALSATNGAERAGIRALHQAFACLSAQSDTEPSAVLMAATCTVPRLLIENGSKHVASDKHDDHSLRTRVLTRMIKWLEW